MSWCLQANRDLPLERALDLHAFADDAMVMGRAACELGNVYQAVGKLIPNRSAHLTFSCHRALTGIRWKESRAKVWIERKRRSIPRCEMCIWRRCCEWMQC